MREHNAEEKPHVCNFCNKVFNTQNDLNEHGKTHSNKPYKCDVSSFERFEDELCTDPFAYIKDLSETIYSVQ